MVVKEKQAEQINSQIHLTTKGQIHLGAVVGHSYYKKTQLYCEEKEWVVQIIYLFKITRTQPNFVYSTIAYGLQH